MIPVLGSFSMGMLSELPSTITFTELPAAAVAHMKLDIRLDEFQAYMFSRFMAKYGMAAFMQDSAKGWEFYDALFNNADQYEREGEAFLKATAARVGLDFKKLKAEAGGAKVQERLDIDRAEADKFGISGTPYFIVNDLIVRGAVPKDMFEEAIEMALRLRGKK